MIVIWDEWVYDPLQRTRRKRLARLRAEKYFSPRTPAFTREKTSGWEGKCPWGTRRGEK